MRVKVASENGLHMHCQAKNDFGRNEGRFWGEGAKAVGQSLGARKEE